MHSHKHEGHEGIDPAYNSGVYMQAERMMSVLRNIAAQGCTVIVTIHQPSSKVIFFFGGSRA